MEQITIELPDLLSQLPSTERTSLIQAGIAEAVRMRAEEIRGEVAEAEAQVARFTARYGMDFHQFETEYIQQNESPDAHEAYNDWFYWQQVLERSRALLGVRQK